MIKKTLAIITITGMWMIMILTGTKSAELTNLALNRSYSASSSEAAGTPSELGPYFAFDGDPNTRWSSVFKDVKDCFIEVNFGKQETINSVSILECKNWAHVTGFRIDVNQNGTWKTVYTGKTIIDNKLMYFDTVTTDKLRLVFDSAEGNLEDFLTVTLYEVGVYYDEKGPGPDVGESGWFDLPFTPENSDITGKYIYVLGGYHSIDNGCPAWGTANLADIRFIGDEMGTLLVEYRDGTKNEVPLIFGYTMWYKNNFKDGGAPFKTDEAIKEMKDLLDKSLYLKGGYESNDVCVLKVMIDNKPIKKIEIVDNKAKTGTPIFSGAYLVSDDQSKKLSGGMIEVNTGDSFFKNHVVDAKNPYPEEVKKAIEKINYQLLTYSEDYINAPEYKYPSDYKGVQFVFKGNDLAKIATGIVAENLINLMGRVDADGMMHTSYKDAPSWRYDGFGTWVPKANSYYDSFYSRDGARAIMTLNSYGQNSLGDKSVVFANKAMMYFREKGLTLKGVQIPGHFSVIVNKPLIYSQVLTGVGWFTKYTKSAFGDEYQNMGNQETDGHGLMMLANWNIWKNAGKESKWVQNNWRELKEAADFILWCFENPTLSFASKGLLYAESEAGMGEYTLYCNVPCYLGLLGYAEMADSIGDTTAASAWRECAATMLEAINTKLAKKDKWNLSNFGFYHDPVLTMMSDMFGYDTKDMIQDWVTKSINVYEEDITRVRNQGHFGPAGIGYDHSMITQNALLLDMMADANLLVENLTKLSYAPRLPEPYLVPEGISVDWQKGIIRRQGDLGNLVQLAEALKCYHLVAGISPVKEGVLKIMPRLPKDWEVNVSGYDIQNAKGLLNLLVTYPKDGAQIAKVSLAGSDVNSVELRFGPFSPDTKNVLARVNGKDVECRLEESGDSKWAWIKYSEFEAEDEIALIYSETDEMPEWPVIPKTTEKPVKSGGMNSILLGVLAALAVICLGSGTAYFIVRKKSK